MWCWKSLWLVMVLPVDQSQDTPKAKQSPRSQTPVCRSCRTDLYSSVPTSRTGRYVSYRMTFTAADGRPSPRLLRNSDDQPWEISHDKERGVATPGGGSIGPAVDCPERFPGLRELNSASSQKSKTVDSPHRSNSDCRMRQIQGERYRDLREL